MNTAEIRVAAIIVGLQVMCRWGQQREYFPGKISRVKGLKVDVDFDDGGRKRRVDLVNIYVVGDDQAEGEWVPSIAH